MITASPFVVALLGEWPMLNDPNPTIHLGSLSITRCPNESSALKDFASRLSPTWLLVGQGLDEENLSSLAADVMLMVPKARLAILGIADDVAQCDRWLARGASAYLRSTLQPAQLIEVMLLAEEADVVVIDAAVPRLRVARQAQLRLNLVSRSSALTKREREVLRLVRLGKRNAIIAVDLELTESTIEFHVSNILSKLGARSRTEAVDRANALGI